MKVTKIWKKIVSLSLVILVCSAVPDVATAKKATAETYFEIDGEYFRGEEDASGEGWKYDHKNHRITLDGFKGLTIFYGIDNSTISRGASYADIALDRRNKFTIYLAEGSINSVVLIHSEITTAIKGKGTLVANMLSYPMELSSDLKVFGRMEIEEDWHSIEKAAANEICWEPFVMETGEEARYNCISGEKELPTLDEYIKDISRFVENPENTENNGTKEASEEINEYIYDAIDPSEDMILPVDMLEQVTDVASAAKAIEATVQGMTAEQKQSPTGIDLATLSAETAATKAASKEVSGNEIVIDKASVSDLQAVAAQASTAVESALVSGGVTPERTLSKTVTLASDSTDELSIRIEPDILSSGVDKVRVETPSCALTFKVSDLEADLTKPLTVTLQEIGADEPQGNPAGTMAAGIMNYAEGYDAVDMGIADISALANPVKKVAVKFPNGKMTNAVTVSMPSGGGDKTYQAVMKDDGKATASKYNPATTAIDGKINTSGTYMVQANQKDFSDISGKSAEMQKAIRYLASKGIINGTTETTFSPDQSISRAQIASLMVQALGKMDNSATANFTDVPKNCWYYHQAASSQKHGLFSGYEDNTFRGNNVIQKDQLINVAGNVLVKEMGYKSPGNPSVYLSKYSDNVAGWAQPMVALATKENLVVYRTNGTFGGKSTMTRGDAAIIIYRLFMKIW